VLKNNKYFSPELLVVLLCFVAFFARYSILVQCFKAFLNFFASTPISKLNKTYKQEPVEQGIF